MQKMQTTAFGNPLPKQILLEVGIALGIVLTSAYSIVAVPVGLVQWIVQGGKRTESNPLSEVGKMWRMFGKHFKYLWKFVWSPAFREASVEMNFRALEMRENWRRTGKAFAEELQYIDPVTMFYLFYNMFMVGINLLILVTGIVSMIAAWGYVRYYDSEAQIVTHAQPKPAVVYQPQVADQQEQEFGPWYNVAEVQDRINNPKFTNLALLSDIGSVEYSQHWSASKDGFKPDFSEMVVNAHIENGKAIFSDQHGNEFTLNPNQPFMFEQYDYKVYLIDQKGKVLSIIKTTLHKEQH